MSSIRPKPAAASGSHRKKPLTEAEKARIWRFHKENPLVTHLDIASTFTCGCSFQVSAVDQYKGSDIILDWLRLECAAFFGIERRYGLNEEQGDKSSLPLNDKTAPSQRLYIRVISKNFPLPKTIQLSLHKMPPGSKHNVLILNALYQNGFMTAIAQEYPSQERWSESRQRYLQPTHGNRITSPISTRTWLKVNRDGMKLLNRRVRPRVGLCISYSELESWNQAKTNQSQSSGSASFVTTPANSTDPSHFSYADTWNQQQAAISSWDPPSGLAGTNNIPGWTGLEPVNNADHVSTGTTPCSPMPTGPARSSDLDGSSIQFCSVYSNASHAIDTLHGHLAQTSEPTALDMFCLRHLRERLKGGAPLDGWYRCPFSWRFPIHFPSQRGRVFLITYLLLKRGLFAWKIKHEQVKQVAIFRSAPILYEELLASSLVIRREEVIPLVRNREPMYVNENETVRSRPLVSEIACGWPAVIVTPMRLYVHER